MNKNLANWIIKTVPKKWTPEDIELLNHLKNKGYNNIEIWKVIDRSEISVQIKYKRLHKKDDSYNKKHIVDKYKQNDEFINLINPKSLLDAYAWNKYYSKFNIPKYITNDKDIEKDTDYHLEVFEFISKFYNKKFDIVDLDPFGSAFDCYDLAIQIAQKWLIITIWELWHRRWKRLDFVKHRYWIDHLDDNWVEKITNYIINRWLIYKKKLIPIIIKDWNNIWRIYFTVEQFKETSQWEK